MTVINDTFQEVEDLTNFVSKTAQKRTDYINRRSRDLRIEAVLEATLKRTQNELDSHRKSKKRKYFSINEDWLKKNGPKRLKPDDEYEWCPDENGQWGNSKKDAVEDLFNLTEFFKDLNEVCQKMSTSS